MSTHPSGNFRTVLLLYFFWTGFLTVLAGIVLNQFNLLTPPVPALATSIAGFITIIAGAWVVVERFFLPQKPTAAPRPRLSGLEKTLVFLISLATTILLSTFFVEFLPPILGNSPEHVVTTFCDDISRGDSVSAYTQFGSSFMVQVPWYEFISNGANGAKEPTSCNVSGRPVIDGQSAFVKVTATEEGIGQGVGIFELERENGEWKINNESFPNFTAVEFCNAITKQDSSAYDYFSPDLKRHVSRDKFRQKWLDPSWYSCSASITSWSGTQARFTMQTTQSYFDSRPVHLSGSLVADSNGVWRIESIQ